MSSEGKAIAGFLALLAGVFAVLVVNEFRQRWPYEKNLPYSEDAHWTDRNRWE